MSNSPDSAVPKIDAELVRRLLREQFPEWADQRVRPVDLDGWDNRTFRIGDTMSARLPSAAGYAPQVRKEVTWLPYLAASLSMPIPEVVATGAPGADYPFEWTVRGWIEGAPAAVVLVEDSVRLALDLASFLLELQSVNAVGPRPGVHSAFRGGSLEKWDAETRLALSSLGERIDTRAATAEWDRSLAASSTPHEAWFHGDIAPGNLLMNDGRLSAVIDFGCTGVGDPACDLAIAWAYFEEPARSVFLDTMAPDDALRQRGRGWALWKALITLDDPVRARESARTLTALGVLPV